MKRIHVLAAVLGLILAVNAAILAGIAWNRSAPPDSRLSLSERELASSRAYSRMDNSGIALRLDYRWPTQGTHPPGQLPAAKMAELGFAVPSVLDDESVRRYRRQLDRDGYLVLELDGPLYRQQLADTEQRLQDSTRDLRTLPDNKELQEAQQSAAMDLQREQTRSSRLFVANAGLDREALRALYPDRQHYVILPARISAWAWRNDNRWQIGGSADIPLAAAIHLPQRWHALFGRLPLRKPVPGFPDAGGDKLFTAEVAFGKRLEPWIETLRAGQP